ncbi:MAG: hypothetical protein SFZ24_09395 [Planctomycetota bacterium]|nr:hypothetical protein [Planctomycetota bacterium]
MAMEKKGDLRQGTIVWTLVTPPRGDPKVRPVVIITDTAEMLLNSPIVGLFVTTQFALPVEPPAVALPWSLPGHPATGLRKPSVVLCQFPVEFRASDVEGIAGYVPTKTLVRILQIVADLNAE